MRASQLSKLLFGAWLVILINGTLLVMTEECSGDHHLIYTTTGRICCPKCERNFEEESCTHDKMECRCRQGYGCQTRSCTECIKLPVCNSNERLKNEFRSNRYHYSCEKCPPGMVLDKDSGMCKPSTMPTTTLQSLLIQSSNAKYPTAESNDYSNKKWTFIWGLVVIFLLLITIAIHLLIQKMKTEKALKFEDHAQSHTNIPINTKDDMDTSSCQYPEEEHGDGALNKPIAF